MPVSLATTVIARNDHEPARPEHGTESCAARSASVRALGSISCAVMPTCGHRCNPGGAALVVGTAGAVDVTVAGAPVGGSGDTTALDEGVAVSFVGNAIEVTVRSGAPESGDTELVADSPHAASTTDNSTRRRREARAGTVKHHRGLARCATLESSRCAGERPPHC